ncbi:hypothetical protein B0T16DRAFT_452540 [Cercophora newfieldiana]|uniref:Rhodopsin domain-containing protein n=1 Tax=Cercophora newfieldiana TaxID=92897 RepID=A0AA39YSV7_9PEZI|nr:hypothetical protein B0T16DRAFT_452540 [Cercophora newfieldiana]
MPTNGTWPWGPPPANAARSLQADIIVCAIITWIIAFTFVVLRFYTRCRLKHILGPTDWCILPALLFSAGVSASSIEQAFRGAGRHAWDLNPYGLPALERATWYGILFYNLSLVFTRISILLLYKRIFTYNWAKRAIQVGLVIITATGIWFIASVATACVPLEAFWDWSLFMRTQVYCQPPNLWWGNAAIHIAEDLFIVILPMPILSSLNLPKKQKFALVGLFGLGFFVCIVTALRLVTLVEIQSNPDADATYTSAQIVYWSTAEVNALIVCSCIMTLKPLVQKWFPNMLSPSHYGRDRSLRWITPITNTQRQSRQSLTRPLTGHQRNASDSIRKRGEALPRVEEKEHAVADDAHKSLDLEAQRSGSVSTVVCDDDPSIVGMSALSAPPKAHLRLSIHVRKSVEVSRYPESPMTNESFEKERRRSSQDQDYFTPPYTPGWQSEGSTILICKDFAEESGNNK